MGEVGGNSLEPPGEGDKVVAEGGELQVACLPPKSLPKASVHWLKPHGPLTSDILTIEGAKLHDAGNYTCVISNMADTKHVSFNLIVASKYFSCC